MKMMKQCLKAWNRSSFGNMEDNITKVVAEIKLLDDKGEFGTFSEGDILKRREFFEEFWKLSRMKEEEAAVLHCRESRKP